MLYSSWLVPDLGGNIHNFLQYHFANNIFDSSEIDFNFRTPTILQDFGQKSIPFCIPLRKLTAHIAILKWYLLQKYRLYQFGHYKLYHSKQKYNWVWMEMPYVWYRFSVQFIINQSYLFQPMTPKFKQ